MDDYQTAQLINAANRMAVALENIAGQLETLGEQNEAILHALWVNDTNGEGIADVFNEANQKLDRMVQQMDAGLTVNGTFAVRA